MFSMENAMFARPDHDVIGVEITVISERKDSGKRPQCGRFGAEDVVESVNGKS